MMGCDQLSMNAGPLQCQLQMAPTDCPWIKITLASGDNDIWPGRIEELAVNLVGCELLFRTWCRSIHCCGLPKIPAIGAQSVVRAYGSRGEGSDLEEWRPAHDADGHHQRSCGCSCCKRK